MFPLFYQENVFYAPWKSQKTIGFLTISGDIKGYFEEFSVSKLNLFWNLFESSGKK